ncbi:MAG: DUF2849 domain-containing protein [Defluviicoccus sp.]|nr:DUF2849 domain-containing protein [Defluviicoccus sp.]MDE0274372.1 DUF2849 domain-containing protein [Defluviicoccus sp.]
MARAFRPCVLTANDLFDGAVVYLDPDGAWTRRPGAARLLEDEAEANRRLAAAAREDAIVDPYLAEAVPASDGRPKAVHVREALRATGPSNYDHGKQAGS